MSNYYNRQWRLPNNENKDKQSNYSMDFDGSSQQINSSSNLGISGASPRTFSAWMKTTDAGGGYDVIVATGNSGNTGNNFELDFRNNVIMWERWGLGIMGSVVVNDGNWHHACITYDGNILKLYVDGSEDTGGDFPYTIGATTSTDTPVRIGGMNHSAKYFNGQIDGVSIFNYALSSSQVTTLYGSSSTGIGNPMAISGGGKPVAYYPLGDQDSFNGSNYLVPNSSLKDYVFDFDANYIDLGDSDNFSFTNGSGQDLPFTLSAWVNMDDASSFRIITKYGTNTEWYLYTTGSDILRFRTNDSSTGGYIGRGYSTAMTSYENKWIHIVGTYDGSESNSGFKLYINATRVDDTDAGSGTYNGMVNSTDTVKIGKMTGSDVTNGKMSNVQIFNTVLPATGSNSIETLYNNGSPLTSMSGYSSLVGWWKLDASATYDSSTTTWTIPDDSTNSNDGTSSGMTQANLVQSDLSFTSGYSPYALSFDGTNDYIDCGNLQPSTTSLSISAWAYKTDTTNASIIGRGASVDYGIFIYSGSLMFGLNSGSWSTISISNFTSNYLNQWFHVCATWDGSTMKLYLNGNEEVSASKTGTITYTSNDTTIGKNSTLSGFEWDGKISNVSIWNTGLTSSQVTELYNEGVPSNLNNHSAYSNLVSWWQLGSNSSFNTNWTVLDEKGSNNGTSVNMAEDATVDGVGSYANGLSYAMSGDEVVGDAPYSSSNSLSVNMDVEDRLSDTPS